MSVEVRYKTRECEPSSEPLRSYVCFSLFQQNAITEHDETTLRSDIGNLFCCIHPQKRLLLLTEGEGVFSFGLAAFVFAALCARALPAGDRFVAGFRRVSLAFDGDLIERRADERGESFLTLLANGVLMREMPRGANGVE